MQEKRFTKAVGEMIALRFIEDWATSDDDGIRVKPGVEENDPAQVLSWTPACEMEGWPDSPEASTYPALPYPFTAKELAAFLLSGAGSMVAEYYGDFSDGPDEVRLQALGAKAGHARDALRQAYTEIRLAIAEVGEVDQQLQQKAHALRHQFNDANLEANRREGLWEAKEVEGFWVPGISEDERRVRRERARQSVEELKMEMDSVGRDADSALKNWNAAMVKALLYPAPELTDAAAPPEADSGIDYSLLATPQQLIEAFGRSTGMDAAWFDKWADYPVLNKANKVKGTSGRGRTTEPLFCPFLVMQGLMKKPRKGSNRKEFPTDSKPWELLKRHFPNVYAIHQGLSPLDD